MMTIKPLKIANLKTCKDCRWWQDEVCCNADSPHCTDYRAKYNECEEWAAKAMNGLDKVDIKPVIKSGVDKALNKPVVDGKSITEWAAIGMKAPRWISVKDKLPDESQECIVYVTEEDGERFVTTDHWSKYVRQWYIFGNGSSTIVTHWRPLPESPKEEGTT
jgi:hypothetical protein